MSIRKIVFLLIALGLWLSALTSVPQGAAVQMQWADTVIHQASFLGAIEQADQPMRAAIWDMKHIDDRTVATYVGDPLLLTGDRMLGGSADICAVSESTAMSVWGSRNVTGLTLALGGKPYVVGGVYPSGVADILIPWDGASEASFKQMAARFPGQPDGAQYQRTLDFASSLGMDAPDEALDAPLLSDIAQVTARMPGWMLMLLIATYQWRILRGCKVFNVPIRTPIVLLCLAGMLFVLGVSTPPKWLLPSRWSDFTHWETLLNEVGGRVSSFVRAAHNPLNTDDLYACLRTLIQGALSAALLYDIRGGWNHAQNVDCNGARHSDVPWGHRGKKRIGSSGSPAAETTDDTGSMRGESF